MPHYPLAMSLLDNHSFTTSFVDMFIHNFNLELRYTYVIMLTILYIKTLSTLCSKLKTKLYVQENLLTPICDYYNYDVYFKYLRRYIHCLLE